MLKICGYIQYVLVTFFIFLFVAQANAYQLTNPTVSFFLYTGSQTSGGHIAEDNEVFVSNTIDSQAIDQYALSPTPSLSSFSYSENYDSLGWAYLQLQYQFVVYGLKNTYIPVNIYSSLGLSVSPVNNNQSSSTESSAHFFVGYNNVTPSIYHSVNLQYYKQVQNDVIVSTRTELEINDNGNIDNDTSNVGAYTYSNEDTLYVLSNHLYSVKLFTSASNHNGLASAHADAYINIDPTFINSSSYSLQFSPGIGNNTSPVPVPGAAWLLGSGLIGLAGLRRKKTAAIA